MRVKVGNSVLKRLTPPPSPWPSPTRGEGITIVLAGMDCFCPFSLEGGPRRQKAGMRVKAGNSVLKRLTPPPQTRRPPLALSHEGRGNRIVPVTAVALPGCPRPSGSWDRPLPLPPPDPDRIAKYYARLDLRKAGAAAP